MTASELSFSTTDGWMLVAILVLIAISGWFALAETGITRISRAKAQAMVDQRRRGADTLLQVVENVERDLNALFLAVLIVQTVQAAMTGVVAARVFGGWGVLVGTFVNVVVVFVVGEAGPKTWALQHPERAALMAAPSVRIVGRTLRLVARALIGVTNVILPGKGLRQGPFVTEEEILALAGEAAEGGGIEESERDLIESIIDFGDTVAREIMVPRTDMVAMQADDAITDMVEVAILNGLSRFPTYGENVDDIVGIVYAKDLMRAERDGRGKDPVSSLMRDVLFVPETKLVAQLLKEMQARSTHIAVVIDEYGGTAGLVTLEDLLEELVGEIVDEFDPIERGVEVEPTGEIVVHDPAINVDDLNDRYALTLPEGDWDSLGGIVFSQLGRVPEVGDSVRVDHSELVVEAMDGRRIARVRIRPLPEESEDEPGDDRAGAT